jgi:hypothetical protein
MESNVNLPDSVPSALCLAQLSDAELLAGTRRLVGRSNQLLAELLLHLHRNPVAVIVTVRHPETEMTVKSRFFRGLTPAGHEKSAIHASGLGV